MKAIAMKCTQEQFDAVKGKLVGMEFYKNPCINFNISNIPSYLTNDYSNSGKICSTLTPCHQKEIHETWNEEIFLNACGIETDYRITKEQILKAHNSGFIHIKQWFPEVFKTVLEAGKWYKGHDKFMFQFNGKDNTPQYGFCCSGNWNEELLNATGTKNRESEFTEATPQEVETALIAEAKKMGFEKGVYIQGIERKDLGIVKLTKEGFLLFDNETLNLGNQVIMKNGTWATIIHTITKKEAEEKLNCKIV